MSFHREQWPSNQPIPEYEIILSDGCIPSNLHNLSDRPQNFPTLDTLPRERRGHEYSDAYDGNNSILSGSQVLKINPALHATVASKATVITAGAIPPNLATTWEAQHPNVSFRIS